MDNIRDHPLQHLAQLEESWRDAGADLQPLAGDLTDVLAHIAPAIDGVVQQLLYWIIVSAVGTKDRVDRTCRLLKRRYLFV